MPKFISKSQFKPRAFEYFRLVEETNTELIITDHNKPVLKIVPYAPDDERLLRQLRGLVERYEDPTGPVGADWEVLK